jgi:outer membrane protein assembly factor BamE
MRVLRLSLLAVALSTTACSVVYKVDVNQGNLIEKEMVDSLKPGMTRRQVSLIMGTPSVASPFDQNRWDYTASFSHRGHKAETKTLTLFFDNDVLARIEGDYFPQRDDQLLEDTKRLNPGRALDLTVDKKKKARQPAG